MFNNIGKKIKLLAQVIFYIGVILSAVAALACLAIATSDGLIPGLLMALVVAAVGCLLSYLSVMLLYGFGELIDKATAIEENTRHCAQ